jgi:hypothetical protein
MGRMGATFRPTERYIDDVIVWNVSAWGEDVKLVARELGEKLVADQLSLGGG